MNKADSSTDSGPAGAAGPRLPQRIMSSLAPIGRSLASRFGASITIVAFGVVLIGLLWGAVVLKIRAEKGQEIKTVTKDTGNLARAFEEHVLRTIREADQVLLFIIDRYREHGTRVDLRRLMEDGPIISRIYTGLGVIDARGDLVAGTRPLDPASFPDREHFRVHSARDTGQLFIGRPLLQQASGRWSIQLSRRINNPDLSFAGVAVVSIDPQTFSKLYSQTDLGEQAMITLVGRDGVVLARRSRNEANTTVDTSRWALFRLLPSTPTGSYISTGSADGLKRIYSYRSLTDYPLVVVVGAAEREALAEFHARRRGYFEAAALATLVILGFTAFLLVMVWRQETLARALRRHNTELGRALEANTRLAAIVENSNDAIISRALDGTVISWNAGAERVFGYTAAEAIGRSIEELIVPPDIRERVAQNVERVRRGEILAPYETRGRTKQGRIVDVLSSVSPIRNEAGVIIAASVILRDISALKRAETELAQLAAIVRSSDDAIVSTTPEGVIQTWNAGAESLFGHTAQQAVGQPITLVYPAPDQVMAWRNLEAIKHGKRHYEATRVRRDGSVAPVSVTAFPILAQAGAVVGIGAIYRDISERRKADAAIKASETRLRAILDNDPECVALISPQGMLMEINRAGLAMLECGTIEQVRNHGLANFVQSERRDCFTDYLGRCSDDEPADIELEISGLKGTRRWLQCRLAPVRLPESGSASLLVVARDITEHKRNQERIEYLSHHDALTGLPNRNLFQDRLELAVARARRRDEVLGVLLVNLDRFKKVNESLGREAGDGLLREVASRLKTSLREVDTIARLGGDDYAVLVEGTNSADDVTAVAEKLIQTLAAPFDVRGHEIFVSASVGVASCSDGACEAGRLLEGAEIAISRAKEDGGSGYQLYQDEPITMSGKRLTFETRLRHALERNELAVHYQPRVDFRTGAITGAEALLRWNSPELGQIGPAEFIPIAEETGLIVPISAWVLETACAQATRWRSQGHDLGIAVNLSPRQFRQKDLVNGVARVLGRSGLDARQLVLEITEGTAMTHAEQTIAVLNELHVLGVKLAVDDFGTGYSSLNYLRRFPLHYLKIDRSFIKGMADNPQDMAIITTIIALAHSLNLRVVAEGVETDAHSRLLKLLRCDEAQGYLYSRALPAAEFLALLERSGGVLPSQPSAA